MDILILTGRDTESADHDKIRVIALLKTSVDYAIDYDYQYDIAAAASENGVERYILVSSVGASASSTVFYL